MNVRCAPHSLMFVNRVTCIPNQFPRVGETPRTRVTPFSPSESKVRNVVRRRLSPDFLRKRAPKMARQGDFAGLSADSFVPHDSAVSNLRIEMGDVLLLPAPARLWMKIAETKVDKDAPDSSRMATRKLMARLAGQLIVDFEAASWENERGEHLSSSASVARLLNP